jgi:hypothetical protein
MKMTQVELQVEEAASEYFHFPVIAFLCRQTVPEEPGDGVSRARDGVVGQPSMGSRIQPGMGCTGEAVMFTIRRGHGLRCLRLAPRLTDRYLGPRTNQYESHSLG